LKILIGHGMPSSTKSFVQTNQVRSNGSVALRQLVIKREKGPLGIQHGGEIDLSTAEALGPGAATLEETGWEDGGDDVGPGPIGRLGPCLMEGLGQLQGTGVGTGRLEQAEREI